MLTFPKVVLAVLCSTIAVCSLSAGGVAERPPILEMQQQPRVFIAPGNADAVVRSLSLPFKTVTLTTPGQVITSWTFRVFDSRGVLVSEESRVETRDRGFFGELFNLGPRPQVDIPGELTWDGTYHLPSSPLSDRLVPDGNYTYLISIRDSAGGRAQTPPFNVTVKNSPLIIQTIRLPVTVFSPTGERSKVRFEQLTSREQEWEGRLSDASGRIVRTIVWSNPTDDPGRDVQAPDFEWDGRANDSSILPDGQYVYTLTGRNRAGALLSKSVDGLWIDTHTGTASLSSDSVVVSPNGDGALDSLNFIPAAGSPGLQKWSVEVSDAKGGVRWQRVGTTLPPSLNFDGKDPTGTVLPEGTYSAVLRTTLQNGDTSVSRPLAFRLSVTPPKVDLEVDNPVFGQGVKESAQFKMSGDPGVSWTLAVTNSSGKVILQRPLGSSGQGSFEFGVSEGATLPDGLYTVQVSGRNEASTMGSVSRQVRKDSRPLAVGIELSRSTLVPGTNPQGRVRLTPVLASVDSIVRMSFAVTDSRGIVVARKEAQSIIPFWDWTGARVDGTAVADAVYSASVEVAYENGAVSTAEKTLTVDSRFLDNRNPQINLATSSASFAPLNIDGPQSLHITVQAVPGSDPLAHWSVTILDPRGRPFRSLQGKGTPPSDIVWDGKSDNGEYVESGEDYQIVATASDSKDRTAQDQTMVTADIVVQKLGDGRYRIVVSSIQYGGYSSDVFKVSPELLQRNITVLQKLSSVLIKFPEYKIQLDGYAVSEFWDDTKSAASEQERQLIPLSRDRAEEVRNALVLLGVDSTRFKVRGLGSEQPVVPNSDLENRWKNRRVEFYLEKK